MLKHKYEVFMNSDVIDFFLSHSWHDDAEKKWEMLLATVRHIYINIYIYTYIHLYNMYNIHIYI